MRGNLVSSICLQALFNCLPVGVKLSVTSSEAVTEEDDVARMNVDTARREFDAVSKTDDIAAIIRKLVDSSIVQLVGTSLLSAFH
jgi:hypothetical protein